MNISKRTCLLFVLSLFLVCIGLVFVIYGSVDYEREDMTMEEADRVGVVVDAGGSGTRLIIYSYTNDTFHQLKYKKCEDEGMTKYTEYEFPTLRQKLKACFAEGASSLPKNKQVPLYFAATAGMRLLELRNATIYEKIWKLVRECIDESEFKLSEAGTISGFDEAKLAWVSANYLKHTIKGNKTFGTIELGSSSVQLAFQQNSNANKSDNIETLNIDGTEKTIYAHSYLCFGGGEMQRRLFATLVKNANYTQVVNNPCFFRGFNKSFTSEYLWAVPCSSGEYAKKYLGEDINGPAGKTYVLQGSSNFSECLQTLNAMIGSTCTKGSCGMLNEFQPKPQGLFLAFSALYYVADLLKQTVNSTKLSYKNAAKELCGRSWTEHKIFAKNDQLKYTDQRCFQAAYSFYLLDSGFKFDSNTWKVEYVKEINGIEAGWSLGLIYTNKESMYPRMIAIITIIRKSGLIALIVIGAVCLIAGLVVSIVAWKRRK